MALFIKPDPINWHNIIRWHQADDLFTDADRIEGYIRCTEFTNWCDGDVYALPARPDDYFSCVINFYSWGIYFSGLNPDNLVLGVLKCCEFSEIGSSSVSSVTNSAGKYIRVDGTIPDFEVGETFNLCLFHYTTGVIHLVSNPFRIVSEEYAQCDTLILIGNAPVFKIDTQEYYPASFSIENRIDAKLLEQTSLVSKEEYRTTAGVLRRRNEIQIRQFTLAVHACDDDTHEALSLMLGFRTDFYTHEYAREFRLVPNGSYTIDAPANNFDTLRTATVTMQATNNIVSFRTC